MPRRGLDAAQVADAAARIADADGLDAVTIARVASELGVRPPSLYNHVASRDALLDALARQGYEQLGAALADATAGLSGPDAVRALAGAYRGYARAARGRYLAMQRPLPDEAGARRVVRLVAKVLGAWRLQGDEEVHAIRALRSAMHGFIVLEQSGGFAIELELDASYRHLVELLVSGLGSPAAAG